MKTLPDHVYRGYDLRGLVGTELNDETMAELARAYATWLIDRRIYDCVIGYDSRTSSPHFRDVMVKTLTDSGITVYDIGISLSQICYFAQYYFQTRGMIMITASHNPKEYNGLKLGSGFSDTMITEEVVEFRELVKSGNFKKRNIKGKHIQKDVFEAYLQDLLKKSDPIKPFKVVIDSCAATTGLFLPRILRAVGCIVIEQNTTPDGNFPVGIADPTEKEVQERLARRVVEEKADMGFSYDTDGDRIGIVDEKGGLIWNDVLVSIFSEDILELMPKAKIIYNALCSKQVSEVIKNKGGNGIMWKVGHSFIKAKVREERAVFGGELSGHFFFMDNFYGHDDGAMATLRVLSYLTRVNKTLSEVVKMLPHYFSSPEIKVGCPDQIKFDIVTNQIGVKMKETFPQGIFTTIDGVRMDTDTTMLIVRASQNGPYLTIKFEGKTEEEYNMLKQKVSTILHFIQEIDFKSGTNTDSLQ